MGHYTYGYTGVYSAGQYQISGEPFITGSAISANDEQKVEFPRVAREFTVIKKDSAGTLYIHFASTGSNNVVGGRHYVELTNNDASFTFRCRTKEVWISEAAGTGSDYTIVAELTGIKRTDMPTLTGSGISD